jgi:hypothetical protein
MLFCQGKACHDLNFALSVQVRISDKSNSEPPPYIGHPIADDAGWSKLTIARQVSLGIPGETQNPKLGPDLSEEKMPQWEEENRSSGIPLITPLLNTPGQGLRGYIGSASS